VYRVILRVEPTGASDFVRTLGTGVKDLFYLPAKAVVRSPRDFGRAVAAGGASFARGVMLAPARPAGKMAASLLSSTDRALQAMAMTSSEGALTVSPPPRLPRAWARGAARGRAADSAVHT
jgi:hypothetical protein